jgi:hypothetical protein
MARSRRPERRLRQLSLCSSFRHALERNLQQQSCIIRVLASHYTRTQHTCSTFPPLTTLLPKSLATHRSNSSIIIPNNPLVSAASHLPLDEVSLMNACCAWISWSCGVSGQHVGGSWPREWRTHGEDDVGVFQGFSDKISSFPWNVGILQDGSSAFGTFGSNMATDLFPKDHRNFTLVIHVSLLNLDQGIIRVTFPKSSRVYASAH